MAPRMLIVDVVHHLLAGNRQRAARVAATLRSGTAGSAPADHLSQARRRHHSQRDV